jgi:hypothetical protein
MTARRVLIVVLGIPLCFGLTAIGAYVVSVHTTSGRLATFAVLHSHDMSYQQIRQAIGQDPITVIRNAGMLMSAIDPVVGLAVAVIIACVERRVPGRMTALILAPYFLWALSKSAFSVPRPAGQMALMISKAVGTNVMYIVVAVFVATAIARLSRGRVGSSHVVTA